ncbi:hypothetical protein [Roseovarius sp. D0-M9]|uniref:hypothetical protein n=1 Tax=Roseovarius sp. D0-M9 TaxID=3127117 RepID=UPI00300FF2E0
MNYARIVNDQAVDISTDPASQFHPDLAAEFVKVPEGVKRGWLRAADGTWFAPADPVPTEPEPERPAVSPVEFKLLFTSAERVKLKELRATDPILDDFWSIVDDPRATQIRLSLSSTQQGVGYAVQELVTAGTVASADADTRIAEILSGTMQ